MKKALHISLFLFSLVFNCLSVQASEPVVENNNKVYMHYMGWFGKTSTGNHWVDGTTREPLIGYYDSQSWATHVYQILLSSACGVDGLVVNVRTEYDETSLKAVLPSLKRITDIDNTFDYKVAVSYDDQDMTQEAVETELTTLKNDIIASTDNYLYKDGEPVIFIWDYAGFLTSDNYRTAVSNVFTEDAPILLRNEIDFDATVGSINSYYPWVQGYAEDGSNWGEGYLNWYYNTIADKIAADEVDFSTGGVWPGFDDRDVSWGQNRWIDRNDGATYESIWDIVHAKSVDWVILETWNDWNEGTELEPSVEHGFTYVNKTAANIAEFKGITSTLDEDLLSASTKVYEAAALIESEDRDYDLYYPVLEDAIQYFIDDNGAAAAVELDKIIDDALAPEPIEPVDNDETKRVYMHYLGWFSEGKDGNHWKDGTAQEPIIGQYNSQSWSTHLYHILLSSAVGVDGMVVNVRTEYDEESLKKVLPSLQRIVDVKSDFDYTIAVSYDDQDMTKASVEEELTTLKNDIIGKTDHYMYKNDEPVIFIWNYDGFLTSDDYRDAVSSVFTEDAPILLRNEIDFDASKEAVESYYPWVQGFDAEGTIWGEDYLDWYYRTLKVREDIVFATGAVWPGFDDRKASWGQDRWIDRKDGETYQKTWDLVHDFSDDVPLNWIILETWNDWNEGTEIEPSKEHGFTYMTKTAENIATFKDTEIVVNEDLFSASTKIYQAAQLIETEARDYEVYYPKLEEAIVKFVEKDAAGSIELSNEIINQGTVLSSEELLTDLDFVVYPNPSSSLTTLAITLNQADHISIKVINTGGEIVNKIVRGKLNAGVHEYKWDAKGQTGLYIIQIETSAGVSHRKVMIK
ncbi:MAG: T9SS type A sorting domain-containing protein [Reichenbachiella sp.]|uniref:T9SS type A sorting domain-containing protein n=2 Tax=Reichenbachiella sp. TaxID=2184521 RepID=UPI003298DB55